MNLDDAQKKTVSGWIHEGLNLAGIQQRLVAELGISLTYMEVRLLVDDLKLTPKDTERTRPVELGSKTAAGATPTSPPGTAGTSAVPGADDGSEALAPAGGNVSLTVDQLARPGTVVSGKVTFTDGKSAEWYLDQTGRLGLVPAEKSYKPSATDVQLFQLRLQHELSKMGF